MTCQEIADVVGYARTSVLKFLRVHGFKVDKPGSNRNRKRGLGYGQHSDQKDHKRVLENIKKMRELRDKGFSYEKIASVFNSMKIPTNTRSGIARQFSLFYIENLSMRVPNPIKGFLDTLNLLRSRNSL